MLSHSRSTARSTTREKHTPIASPLLLLTLLPVRQSHVSTGRDGPTHLWNLETWVCLHGDCKLARSTRQVQGLHLFLGYPGLPVTIDDSWILSFNHWSVNAIQRQQLCVCKGSFDEQTRFLFVCSCTLDFGGRVWPCFSKKRCRIALVGRRCKVVPALDQLPDSETQKLSNCFTKDHQCYGS